MGIIIVLIREWNEEAVCTWNSSCIDVIIQMMVFYDHSAEKQGLSYRAAFRVINYLIGLTYNRWCKEGRLINAYIDELVILELVK